MKAINWKEDKNLATAKLIEMSVAVGKNLFRKDVFTGKKVPNTKKVNFWQAKGNPEIMRVYVDKEFVEITEDTWSDMGNVVDEIAEKVGDMDMFEIIEYAEGNWEQILKEIR